MINFFRRIRRKHADNNKPIMYLRYAIGEIALVMIGILLALQVNNWNEQRKLRLVEKEILEGIRDDILRDTFDLNDNSRVYQRIINVDGIILDYLTQNIEKTELFESYLYQISNFDLKLDLHRSFYETAKQKGLSIIANKKLRNEIVKLHEWTYPNMLTAENQREGLDHFKIAKEFDQFFHVDAISLRKRKGRVLISKENYDKLQSDKNLHYKIFEMSSIHRELLRRTKKKQESLLIL